MSDQKVKVTVEVTQAVKDEALDILREIDPILSAHNEAAVFLAVVSMYEQVQKLGFTVRKL